MVEPVVEDVEKLKLLRAEKLSTSNIDESEDEDRAISVDIYVRHYKGEFPFSGEAQEISAHWADLSKKSIVYHNTEWTPSTD